MHLLQCNIQITDVVNSGLNGPINLTLVGNELYVAELNTNRISKINITLANPIREDFIT